jgi:hypothetical protein
VAAGQQAEKLEEKEVQVLEEHLKSVAEHTLDFSEQTTSAARLQLKAETGPGGAGVLATTNILSNERAARNLAGINADLARVLRKKSRQ